MLDRRTLLTGIAGAALTGVGTARAQYQPQGPKLAARIAAAQAEDGAILMPGGGSERLCQPYFANLAVLGLMHGAPPARRSQAQDVAKKWLRWYAAHLNADATMDDHTGTPGALKPTGKYDSSDAYAGTFLSAFGAYMDRTGDGVLFQELFPAAKRIAAASRLTLQKSGLTHARPDYPVAYLMDNVEVWHGLDAYARLCETLGKKAEAKESRLQADALFDAIDRWMWQPQEGVYAWAIHPSGKREAGLDKWYPCQMANLMAVALLPEGERRNDLMTRLRVRLQPAPEIRDATARAAAPFDLEHDVWWGLAILTQHDQALLEKYQVHLAKQPWDTLKDVNPALLGHALRVGAGHVTPAPPLDPDAQ